MKILAVSDYIEPLFCKLPQDPSLSDVELLVSCGDLPPEYLCCLVETFQAPLFYVRGNHDLRLKTGIGNGCTNIHGRIVSFNGITLLGLEGAHWYNGGPFQYTEAQMRAVIRTIQPRLRRQNHLDVVISHAAPRHLNDREDLCHRGFVCFRRLIDRYRPHYFLHGHVHGHFASPEERLTMVQRTTVVNCTGSYLIEVRE